MKNIIYWRKKLLTNNKYFSGFSIINSIWLAPLSTCCHSISGAAVVAAGAAEDHTTGCTRGHKHKALTQSCLARVFGRWAAALSSSLLRLQRLRLHQQAPGRRRLRRSSSKTKPGPVDSSWWRSLFFFALVERGRTKWVMRIMGLWGNVITSIWKCWLGCGKIIILICTALIWFYWMKGGYHIGKCCSSHYIFAHCLCTKLNLYTIENISQAKNTKRFNIGSLILTETATTKVAKQLRMVKPNMPVKDWKQCSSAITTVPKEALEQIQPN